MRTALRALGNQERHQFQGTFLRTGYKHSWNHYQPTILLGNLQDEMHRKIADHLWFNYTLGFLRLGELRAGDQLRFFARVGQYEKGPRHDRHTDYRLLRPSRVQRCGTLAGERPLLPVNEPHALIGYIMVVNQSFYRATGRSIEPFYVAAYHQWYRQFSGD